MYTTTTYGTNGQLRNPKVFELLLVTLYETRKELAVVSFPYSTKNIRQLKKITNKKMLASQSKQQRSFT